MVEQAALELAESTAAAKKVVAESTGGIPMTPMARGMIEKEAMKQMAGKPDVDDVHVYKVCDSQSIVIVACYSTKLRTTCLLPHWRCRKATATHRWKRKI